MTTPPDSAAEPYEAFLRAKMTLAPAAGFEVDPAAINPALKDFVRVIVAWAAAGGRRAIFSSFGLHKTSTQIELARLALRLRGAVPLIVVPLGVRHEFIEEAGQRFTGDHAVAVRFIRRTAEADARSINLTNYESVRDGKVDPAAFGFASLDEAAALRGFGGTKTFREFMRVFPAVPYRFVATATPDPNEYVELLAYAAFLDVMDVGEAKTRWFRRDSEKADRLTLHPHKAREFWLWVASWALFVRRPSDLGFSDDGYVLPAVDVRWHEVASDHARAGAERDGQHRMFRDAAAGIAEAARERRDSLAARIAKLQDIRAETAGAHRIIWHDLEAERLAIERAVPGVRSIFGSQDLDTNERHAVDFKHGRAAELATKPQMSGAGSNFQMHCHHAVFLGIGHKFHDFIQAMHRLVRFGQTQPVRVDLIHTDAEREIRRALEAKWARHQAQAATMAAIIQEFGLARASMAHAMSRSIGLRRQAETGAAWAAVNNDSVLETRAMAADSVGLVVTSVPFATQYEYTPSYNDFGHTDDNAHFWRQMDFLTPELYRVLQPGRVLAVHVKDRVVPSGLSGLGFQVVHPFSDEAVAHYRAHGFGFLARKTVTTDVVRENNQTYRLGWSEQCKDGSRMGCGMPEYILLFRKPPTDRSNGYADLPVAKDKPLCDDHGAPAPFDKRANWRKPVPGTGYSRARWQLDAHGFQRSSGDRLLSPAELRDLPHEAIFKLWRERSRERVYDAEAHVAVAEQMDHAERLPSTFMLLPPHSWHPDVWSDVARMRSLNTMQAVKGQEAHLCIAAGSLVLTRAGFKPIETVEVGDEVLTHKGRWRPVLAVQNTGRRAAVTLRAHGVPGLTLTPDHKVWTRRVRHIPWALNHSRKDAAKREAAWCEAAATVGSYVNLKLPPVEEPSVTSEHFWWIVGRWLADGHFEARGPALISCGAHELGELRKKLGANAGGINDTGTGHQVRVLDPTGTLKRVLRRCGRGAAGKQLPPEAYTLPSEQARALLDGYLSGDGHFVRWRRRWMASSVSKKLLLGIAMLAQRAYGVVASVYPGRAARAHMIEGRHVQARQDWILSFDEPGSRRSGPMLLDDGAWKRVRSADPAGAVDTWNLRVAEDESYTAEGCVVKNCPLPFDIVDRLVAQFSMAGETVLDPFAGLMTVPLCALKQRRRGIGIELNPGYWRDGVSYLRAAERELAIPTLFDLLDAEEDAA